MQINNDVRLQCNQYRARRWAGAAPSSHTHQEPLQMQRFTCDGKGYDQRYLMAKIQCNRRKDPTPGRREVWDTSAVGECNETPRLRERDSGRKQTPGKGRPRSLRRSEFRGETHYGSFGLRWNRAGIEPVDYSR